MIKPITTIGTAILTLASLGVARRAQTDFSPPTTNPPAKESSMPQGALGRVLYPFPLASVQEPEKVQNEINDQMEELKNLKFFHLRRDPESGEIFVEAEKDRKKIIAHLVLIDHAQPQIAENVAEGVYKFEEFFNNKVSRLKHVEVDLGKPLELPDDFKEGVATLEDCGKHGVLRPTKRSYIRDHNHFNEVVNNPDGSVYPLSVLLAFEVMTKHGYPIALPPVSDTIGFDPKGAKRVLYIDTVTNGLLLQGIYVEELEGPGELGPGGKNGVIIPPHIPPVFIPVDDTAYWFNLHNLDLEDKKFKGKEPKKAEPAQPKGKKLKPQQFQFPQVRSA